MRFWLLEVEFERELGEVEFEYVFLITLIVKRKVKKFVRYNVF